MSNIIQGDFNVKRVLNADRRVNQGLSTETLTGQRLVVLQDYSWLQIINASTQDVVMPDATTLSKGWSIVVMADATSAAAVNVKSYAAVMPLLLKNVLVDRAYRFTLTDNSTAAGTWHIDFLEEADKLPAERFVDSFNASTDWAGPSVGYYTRTVTQATHLMGTSPMVRVRSGAAAPFTNIEPDLLSVALNGDITIQVPQVPDLRFAGQMIIM